MTRALGRLTKPQADYLLRAMERARVRYGSDYRVVGSLQAKGFVEEAGTDPLCHSTLFKPTLAGLEALADYWMCKDAASGCLAYQQRRSQVDAALADARDAA